MVFITALPSDAVSIAKKLIEHRLVACVNIVREVKSLYRWEGRVVKIMKHYSYVKTRLDLLRNLIGYVKEIHPYEAPEIIALNISLGNPEYVMWIEENTMK